MSSASSHWNRALDALQVVAEGAGREAASTVGRLLGREAEVGEIRMVEGPDPASVARLAGRPDQELVAVGMELNEPLGGRILVLAVAEEAERVSQRLVPDAAAGSLDAVGESALVEVGNIAGSAFASGLARRLGVRVLHGVPRLTRGNPRACLDALAPGAAGPAILVRFGCEDAGAALLLLPDPDRVGALAGAREVT